MLKRILCLLLCVAVLFSFCSLPDARAANESVKTQLMQIYNRFPNGKYWNHVGSSESGSNSVTSTPCSSHAGCSWNKACYCNKFDNAIQCMGYAYKIAYEIVGVSARDFDKSYTLSASKLRVGDIIRFKNDTHSITVTGVKGNRISFTDANWTGKCKIRWSQINLSELKGFSYVLHYKNNNRKNTDLDFYENVYQPDNTELWQNISASSLNIRSDRSVDSAYVASIPSGAEFYIYKHYSDGEYLWGKVKYGAYKGWCALNWAKYISTNGKCAQPSFISAKSSYYFGEATLRWSSVSGADRYVLRICDSGGKLVKKYTTKNCKYTLDIKKTGSYTAKVYAKSTRSQTWFPASSEISFKLTKEKPLHVSDISMKNELAIVCGQNKTLSASALPEKAADKTLTWKSSDKSVATVSSSGKITAKKCGVAEIICTADDKGAYSEKCIVTVKPAKVQKLKQTDSKRDESISLKWNAAKGASYYSIYLYKDGEYTKVSQTTETNYKLSNLKKSKNYYFKVRAVYKKANTVIAGAYSDKLKAKA